LVGCVCLGHMGVEPRIVAERPRLDDAWSGRQS
jgi:hypothetical protein